MVAKDAHTQRQAGGVTVAERRGRMTTEACVVARSSSISPQCRAAPRELGAGCDRHGGSGTESFLVSNAAALRVFLSSKVGTAVRNALSGCRTD